MIPEETVLYVLLAALSVGVFCGAALGWYFGASSGLDRAWREGFRPMPPRTTPEAATRPRGPVPGVVSGFLSFHQGVASTMIAWGASYPGAGYLTPLSKVAEFTVNEGGEDNRKVYIRLDGEEEGSPMHGVTTDSLTSTLRGLGYNIVRLDDGGREDG